jgi:hypothetical protein
MLRFARIADSLNIVVQLLIGALVVGGIDVYFITRALQGYATTPTWLIVAVPVAATLLWLLGASVALHIAIEQHASPHQPADERSGDEAAT